MTLRRATTADIPLILRRLAVTPNPPNEDESTIQWRLDNPSQFVYIDTQHEVVVLLSPRPVERDVIVVWWLWNGAFDPIAHLPALGVALRAVKASIPTSGAWSIWGDFPGEGNTDAERKADSVRQAQEHSSWLGAGVSDKDADNSKMQRSQSTVDEVLAVT